MTEPVLVRCPSIHLGPEPCRGTVTGAQIRDARALLRWTRGDFSRATALPVRVLDRVEATDGEPLATLGQLIVMRHALEKAGVAFTAEPPGVRLRGDASDRSFDRTGSILRAEADHGGTGPG